MLALGKWSEKSLLKYNFNVLETIICARELSDRVHCGVLNTFFMVSKSFCALH